MNRPVYSTHARLLAATSVEKPLGVGGVVTGDLDWFIDEDWTDEQRAMHAERMELYWTAERERLWPALQGQPVTERAEPSRIEIDHVARLLEAAWAKAEPTHGVTLNLVSYRATFADMARAVLADRSLPPVIGSLTPQEWSALFATRAAMDSALPVLDHPTFAAALVSAIDKLRDQAACK